MESIDNFVERLEQQYKYLDKDTADDIYTMLDQFQEKIQEYNSMDLNLECGDEDEWENFYQELKNMSYNDISSIVTYHGWDNNINTDVYDNATSAVQNAINEFVSQMIEDQLEEFKKDYYENIKHPDSPAFDDDEELDESKRNKKNMRKFKKLNEDAEVVRQALAFAEWENIEIKGGMDDVDDVSFDNIQNPEWQVNTSTEARRCNASKHPNVGDILPDDESENMTIEFTCDRAVLTGFNHNISISNVHVTYGVDNGQKTWIVAMDTDPSSWGIDIADNDPYYVKEYMGWMVVAAFANMLYDHNHDFLLLGGINADEELIDIYEIKFTVNESKQNINRKHINEREIEDEDNHAYDGDGNDDHADNHAYDEYEEEEENDGWDDDAMEDLLNVLDRIYDVAYELRNCQRGSFTGCKTENELGQYISDLADELSDQAAGLMD